MKRYSQHSIEVGDFSSVPFWKKAAVMDLMYVSYGIFIVTLVISSYILGAFDLLPYDPHEINLGLLMAPPESTGHLLGTDFMGRDILSRLIIGIQAYFLPGLLAIAIAIIFGTCFGVLAGYWGRGFDTIVTYINNLHPSGILIVSRTSPLIACR